ncbi:MAPEG family protein [Pseudorhodobacter ferrugineus]|uniref:MAPEG family protein n=1 Tax=Pseudorhodobacter ferrugineus TaxID=77008 RepID=UPI0003B68A0A|nr:MAPEG family protein [Pseudorhodobacter ferrugineus]
MPAIAFVAALAVVQYLAFGWLTGRARAKSGLKAPAMTGDAGFERMYRVQMNTIEVMMAFLPALYLASLFWPAYVVAPIAAIYLIGRHLFWRAYVTDPAKRGLGFMLSIVPVFVLLILALIGAVMGLLGVGA